MQLNHIFGLPNPIRTLRLASSERPWKILPIITMAIVVQAYTLVSILAPNSLEVGTASVQTELISIPTIFFDSDPLEHSWGYVPADSCDYALSSGWERTLGQSLQSDELIGWKVPLRCGTGCNYTFEYPAPALRCFDLGPDELFDNDESAYPPPPAPSYPLVMLRTTTPVNNATYSLDFRTADNAMVWRTYNAGNESAVSGVRCSFYNTTQQSTVSFVNNTGIISPRISSYNDPYASFDMPTPKCNESGPIRNSSSSVEAYHTSYFAMANWLFKQLSGSIDYVHVGPQGWSTKPR